MNTAYIYEVKVPWSDNLNTVARWDLACADVLEVFGLPGDRFTSHPSMDTMNFHFKSKKDADLCKILLSDKI